MRKRMRLLTLFTLLLPSLGQAGGEPVGTASDANSELALRLFAEREAARSPQLFSVIAYPVQLPFSSQALEQQNRAMLYWLWSPTKIPGWPAVPYWNPVFPMGWPIISPLLPPPVPSP
jgi:hypothetical protein